jgi:hypothetical protein
MWLDLIVEYLAGFGFGLFIFQSLFMQSMMGGSYWQNVRRSFVPEFVSMNCMMAGMAPVMSVLMMGRDMRAMEPGELLFWGVMSLGVIVGFSTAYPANVWLVAKQLKHGLMTQRPQPAPAAHHEQHEHHEHDAHQPMASDVTSAQLMTIAGSSVLLLALGMIAPANWINLRLSARDVGGAIMPPGMITHRPRRCATWPPSIHAT